MKYVVSDVKNMFNISIFNGSIFNIPIFKKMALGAYNMY